MPPHTPQWTDFLLCAVCCKTFNNILQKPISLACGHTVCQLCLQKLKQRRCPVDQSTIIEGLPVNYALLLLAGVVIDLEEEDNEDISENLPYHKSCCKCMEELATILKPFFVGVATNSGISQTSANSLLSRPMQRKLVTLFCCQLIEEEGRAKAARAARSIGERIVTELILHHQNPQQLSANLWAAVRGRGCQFLGPGMQEDVLRLILLALEDGSALSRKILVLFVVQKLENSYPQASKTAIGHVVQLLYRASCFKVTKQEESSSLMQLKDEYRSYESLRREHDAQIVHIATEAGLRISPEQWSSLLYGDASHKSHMQSIIDKLQTPQSFTQSINELSIVLQRSGDPYNLQRYHRNLDFLANIDPSSDAPAPSWENLEAFIKSVKTIVICLIDFIKNNESNRTEVNINYSARYKTSMCRDMAVHGMCPRFIKCTFAHSQEEMEKYRARNKKSCMNDTGLLPDSTSAAPTVDEKAKHDQLSKIMSEKLTLGSTPDATSVASTISVNTCSSTATESLTDEENDDSSCTSSSRDREISPDSLSHLSATAASFIPTVEKQNLPQMQCKVATVSPHVHLPCCEKSVITTTQTQNAQSQTPPQCVHQHHFAPTVPQHPSVPNIPQHTGQPMHQLMHYGGPNNQIHPNWPGMIQNTMMQAYPDDRHPIQHGPSYVLTYPQTVQVEQCENCLRTNRMYHYPHDALCGHGIQQPVPHQMAYPPPPPTMYQQTRMDGSAVPMGAIEASRQPVIDSAKSKPLVSTKSIEELQKRKHEIIDHLHQNQQRKVLDSYVRAAKESSCSPIRDVNLSQKDAMQQSLSRALTDSYMVARSSSSWIASNSKPVGLTNWSQNDAGSSSTYSLPSYSLSTDGDNASITKVSTRQVSSQVPRSKVTNTSHATAHENRDDDIFIPFDPPLVSKYGPISRMAKAKMKSTDPVQVTADEMVKTLTPITAVTPVNSRPHPTTSRAPSRFNIENERMLEDGHHGSMVSGMASSNIHYQPHTLWDMTNSSVPSPSILHNRDRDINLPGNFVEDSVLANELQAIEMEISKKKTQTTETTPIQSNITPFEANRNVIAAPEQNASGSDQFSLSREEKQQLQHLQLKEYQLSLEARRRDNNSRLRSRHQEQFEKKSQDKQ